MEKLAITLINKIVHWSRNQYAEDEIEIFIYGTECLLNSLITDMLVILWGFVNDSLFESICWLIFFSLYRHHVGGYHAKTSEQCILLSSLLGFSNSYAIIFFSHHKSFILLLVLTIYFSCIAFAPINTKKIHLSCHQQWKEKAYALLLISIAYASRIILPIEYYISIIYALFVATLLIIVFKVSTLFNG